MTWMPIFLADHKGVLAHGYWVDDLDLSALKTKAPECLDDSHERRRAISYLEDVFDDITEE